jgi:DNA-binding PadR family transcriptional regulator
MTSLAERCKHGYAIIQDVQTTTGVRLGPGTLYGVLSRLEQRGLIEPLDSGDLRRRPYRLTPRGAAVLAGRLEDMRRFAAMGRSRLAASTTLGLA